MSEVKEFILTYLCLVLGIVFAITALWCSWPLNIILAIIALVCMFRVVSMAFLEKMSWRIIVFRLSVTVAIAAEICSFYGYLWLRDIFGWITCIGAVISFVNFVIFINRLPSNDEIDKVS